MKKFSTTIIALSLLLYLAGCNQNKQVQTTSEKMTMSIGKESFGKSDGKETYLFTLKNKNGIIIKITNYGGIITSLITPDKEGNFDDIVLGYDSLAGYLKETPYFGSIVGRYANRIAKGKFVLDGTEYSLAVNNGPNHLHGGLKGFDKVVWDAEEITGENEAGLKLHYLSVDGDEGYPGNLDVTVIYSLNNDNELKIEYSATSDKPTPVNLSHHSYFNLAGTSGRDILDQVLYINADQYTVVDETLIPTGELRDVTGSMDFRKPGSVGARIQDVPGGYDHNYVLNNKGIFARIAELSDPETGRTMEVFTDEPGMQFYSGNFLDGSITGKKGVIYNKHFGLCLETQHFPDSPNHPEFPNTILRPGEKYRQTTVYKFGVK
ncbi:MAG: galactose mutarotase [Bacteroidetes bacterium]|nr:galactose mutarotase [Bacteroidota bacterium]